jgi:methyl-accepting chemotaxis protein
MKVKAKLYLCALTGLAGLAVVGVFSLLGMKFVGSQIRQLTEKSTPAQLKTIDFQRALQEHTSNLLRIQGAANSDDLVRLRRDAEKSLSEVLRISGELDSLHGGFLGGGSEKKKALILSETTAQIAGTISEKISSTSAASESLKSMNDRLQDMTRKLSLLDKSIRTVQTKAMQTLTWANESVSRIGVLQGNTQSLKAELKDMKLALVELMGADGKSDAIAARDHFTTACRHLAESEMLKAAQHEAAKTLAGSLPGIQRAVLDKGGLSDTKIALLAAPNEEGYRKFQASLNRVTQDIARLIAFLDNQIELTEAGIIAENQNFEQAMSGTDAAGSILALNSEITQIGSAIEGGVGLLFGIRTGGELDRVQAKLVEKLDAAEKLAKKEGDLLVTGRYTSEVDHLKSIVSSLAEVRSKLLSRGGVVEKLREALAVEMKANAFSLRIREMVEKQREEGMKGVTLAQGEQEKTVLAVNQIIRSSFILIAVLGGVCLLAGMLLANALVRSITKPVNRIIQGLSEGSRQVASASSEVSSASQSLAEGASQQAAGIEETSSSMEEMASVTRQNAENANRANTLMGETSRVVEEANGALQELTRFMSEISSATKETGKIIKTIDEIAFQTNLLALNAAVEAARAGDAGSGFAVVAGEVRTLALRAAGAAKNTAGLIEGTVKKVNTGSEMVTRTNEAFGKVSLGAQKVSGLLAEIAAASTEQFQGVEQINRAVAEIDTVVQQNASSAEQSASASVEMDAQTEKMLGLIQELVTVMDGKKHDPNRK